MNCRTNTTELRKAMIDAGILTITDLATATGVSRDTLSRVLGGKTQPSSHVMFRLIDALHIEPERAGSIFFYTVLT